MLLKTLIGVKYSTTNELDKKQGLWGTNRIDATETGMLSKAATMSFHAVLM